MSDERARLAGLLRQLSLLLGDFVLTSGRPSSYLVDVKRTVLHPEGARLVGRVLLAELRLHFPDAVGVGGRTLGADPLALALALASLDDGGPHLHAFIVRKERKGHGAGRLIEASGGLHERARVVVLDDVVTTGGSSIEAIEAVRQAEYELLGVLALVDREEGGRQAIEAHGVPFRAVLTGRELLGHA